MAPVSGNILDVRIIFKNFNGGDEDIAIDNFTIMSDATLSSKSIETPAENNIFFKNPVNDLLNIQSSTEISAYE